MAITKNEKKANAEKAAEKINYAVQVLKVSARKGKPNCYRFNLNVNGIIIYGMDYVTYTDRAGKERCFMSFPQYKSSSGDDKYYNHCYFPINDPEYADVFAEIEKQISDLL